MPYHDSEFPSILRGRSKRESERLLAAAPHMLEALHCVADRWDDLDEADAPELGEMIRSAIAKAEGR